MLKHPIRADEYRARAVAEAKAGAASLLEQVRTKHERAAQVWADLAVAEDVRGAARLARTDPVHDAAALKVPCA